MLEAFPGMRDEEVGKVLRTLKSENKENFVDWVEETDFVDIMKVVETIVNTMELEEMNSFLDNRFHVGVGTLIFYFKGPFWRHSCVCCVDGGWWKVVIHGGWWCVVQSHFRLNFL